MGNFSEEDIQLAQKVQDTYGVPASVTLAQYALESGYGKSTVGQNNYFNIKGDGQGGYRDYNSKEESFMNYGKLLSGERYTSQTANATTVQEYVQGVKNAGYAEDEKYVDKVNSIIDSNNLTQYDTGKYSGGSSGSSGSSGFSSNGVKWWGDVVIVIFAVLLIVIGVVFIALAFMDGEPEKVVKKAMKKKMKVG